MMQHCKGNCRFGNAVFAAIFVIAICANTALLNAQTAVTTYHNDNNRTG